MLERSDFPLSHMPLQLEPWAQFTQPVVRPKFERREEWRIFADILIASGAPLLSARPLAVLARANRLLRRVPTRPELDPDQLLALLLRLGGKVSLKQLLKHPEGIRLPANEAGTFLGKRLQQKINLAPARILDDLPRLERYETGVLQQQANADERGLYLIGRRSRKSHNSWMHHNTRIRQPDSNCAYLHPDDASTRQLHAGDWVTIGSDGRSIALPVAITTDVMRGVVAVPHGWGHTGDTPQQGPGKGQNINRIIPGGFAHMEPASGQSIMLAHRVSVEKLATSGKMMQ
jgi:formate dehydrogenase